MKNIQYIGILLIVIAAMVACTTAPVKEGPVVVTEQKEQNEGPASDQETVQDKEEEQATADTDQGKDEQAASQGTESGPVDEDAIDPEKEETETMVADQPEDAPDRTTEAENGPEEAKPEEVASKTEKPAPESEPAPEPEPEPKKVEKIITETVYLLKKSVSYYSDGFIDEYKKYVYDDALRPVGIETFGADDSKIEAVSITYHQNTKTETMQNGEGEVRYYRAYLLDSDGNVVQDTLYNAEDEMLSRFKYVYEQGLKIKWEVYGNDGEMLSYTDYVYGQKGLERINNYSPSGELQDYFIYRYDNQGRQTTEEYYDKSGKLQDSKEYVYQEDRVKEERHLGKRGGLVRKTVFEYDENGNPVRVLYYDSSNNVQEIVKHEYITEEIQKVIYVYE